MRIELLAELQEALSRSEEVDKLQVEVAEMAAAIEAKDAELDRLRATIAAVETALAGGKDVRFRTAAPSSNGHATTNGFVDLGDVDPHWAAIEAGTNALPTTIESQVAGDPFATAAARTEAERAKRRDRDARRRERERAKTAPTEPDPPDASDATPPELLERLRKAPGYSWVERPDEFAAADEHLAAIEADVEKASLDLLVEDPDFIADRPRAGFPVAPPSSTESSPAGEPLATWTSSDLEHELYHALNRGGKGIWAPLVTNGATYDEIANRLEGIWPRHGVMFIGPEQSGGKFGHTIQGGKRASFWIGARKTLNWPPTLVGSALVNRIRAIMCIPSPTEAAKNAKATFRDPVVAGGAPTKKKASKKKGRIPGALAPE